MESDPGMPLWASILMWLALAGLLAVAIWTVVRTPGKKHDPGRPRNLPSGTPDDRASSDPGDAQR